MTQTALEEAIYQKYIQPIQRPRTGLVGVELELPIVNLRKAAVDFEVVHGLTKAFLQRFPFDKVSRDDDGHIYLAESAETGDCLSYDCSFNTLELSFGAAEDLSVIQRRFTDYYTFLQDSLRPHRHALTGMGVNPCYRLNHNVPIANGRYRMLFRHLSSYPKYGDALQFHHVPNFGMFSCASQVQLDVEAGQVVEVINTFTRLEPLKALLLANSLWDQKPELLCSRDYFWKNSVHGLNPHNVDLYEGVLHSLEELVAYIKSMSMYCVEREEKYINFAPMPLAAYFASDSVTGEYFDGRQNRQITFAPQLSDLDYLRSFKFEDLTFRGTVEFRSVCCQPVSEALASAALHTGLLENLPALTDLLERDTRFYQQGYNVRELRAMCSRRALPDFIGKRELSALLLAVLAIAEDGLRRRGLGEEAFLRPLYRRAETLTSPARALAQGLAAGVPMEQFIASYGQLAP